MGDFRNFSRAPIAVSFRSLKLDVDGTVLSLDNSVYYAAECIAYYCGPNFSGGDDWQMISLRLLDAVPHNLSAPLNTAAADPNGCAALHPSATHAVRLTFTSGVWESAPDGGLVPYGTYDTPERASATFLFTTSESTYPDCTWTWEDGPADADGRCTLPPADSPSAAYSTRAQHAARTGDVAVRSTVLQQAALRSDESSREGTAGMPRRATAVVRRTTSPHRPAQSAAAESAPHTGGFEYDYDYYAPEPSAETQCWRAEWPDVASQARVLGVADADGDNIIDVCLEGPVDATTLWMLSRGSGMLDANGMPCPGALGPPELPVRILMTPAEEPGNYCSMYYDEPDIPWQEEYNHTFPAPPAPPPRSRPASGAAAVHLTPALLAVAAAAAAGLAVLTVLQATLSVRARLRVPFVRW
eukprot:jgi/Ulvmu1/10153/UM006_0107.1